MSILKQNFYCGTDVRAHNNADGLADFHDTRVYKTDEHNSQSRWRLNSNGDTSTQRHTLEQIVCHFLKAWTHNIHTVQEERKTAQKAQGAWRVVSE